MAGPPGLSGGATGRVGLVTPGEPARSAMSDPGPGAGGEADHTASPGLESMPETVVTRPRSDGWARSSAATAAVEFSTKLLKGPPANDMPPVTVGVPSGSRPSSRCCTRTAAGKHE